MCPQRINPATRRQRRIPMHPPTLTNTTTPSPRINRSKQRTMFDFIRPTAHHPNHPIQQTVPATPTLQPQTVTPDENHIQTPPATPVAIDLTQQTPPSQTQPPLSTTATHQQPFSPDKRNEPWGDMWALPMTAKLFRIVSKNTGTLNPQNLDMKAITNELVHLNASVFAAQETNIHWDPLTKYQIYQ